MANTQGGTLSDMQRARRMLEEGGHTCVLCRGDEVYMEDSAGIAPMLRFMDRGLDMRGFAAADRIVGRAAALLFALAGVSAVYACVLSEGGAQVLDAHGIAHECGTLTASIINREGRDICPMERAVTGIDDPASARTAIVAALERLRAGRRQS